MADKIKLLVALLFVAGGIAGFYYFAEQALLYRVLGLLVVLAAATAVALTTQLGSDTLNFGRSAIVEVRKSVWPSRKETTQTTLIVLVMVVIIGLILWLFDSILLLAVEWLTHRGG